VGLDAPDREVVDADQADARVDETCRGLGADRGEVLVEDVLGGGLRVAGLEQQTFGALDDRVRPDVAWAGDLHDDGGPDQQVEVQRLDGRSAVEEVERGVHVRSGVHAQFHLTDVRDVASGQRHRAVDRERRVAGVDDHPRAERHGDIVDHATATMSSRIIPRSLRTPVGNKGGAGPMSSGSLGSR
jgi:hypothetical protein